MSGEASVSRGLLISLNSTCHMILEAGGPFANISTGSAVTNPSLSDHYDDSPRKRALLDQLRQQGIVDERVLDALDQVPRAYFVEPDLNASAWDNIALSIPCEQTISQPFVVALMTQALELTGTERVLEIGTGSGYQAAVLAHMAREVITIERIPALAQTAMARFKALDMHNVRSIVGDGSAGWEPGAPYNAIMVTAGARSVPPALFAQLSKSNGRMIVPVGPADDEHLRRFRKHGEDVTSIDLGAVRFVPLIVEGRGSEPT